MSAQTYADAAGVMAAWINSRTETLVGDGHRLQMGAHLKLLGGGEPVVYAYLTEQVSLRSDDSAENPDMLAVLSAEVYGGTRQAATLGAVALAEELSTWITGSPIYVSTDAGGAWILAADDIQGPQWLPDGDHPRLLVGWTARVRPA